MNTSHSHSPEQPAFTSSIPSIHPGPELPPYSDSNLQAVDSSMIIEIRQSIEDCKQHGLMNASKWSSELLLSIPHAKRAAAKSNASTIPLSISLSENEYEDRRLEEKEKDEIMMARTCLLTRRFPQVVDTLSKCQCLRAKFLSLYCQFLISERNSIHDWHKLDNTRHQPPVPINISIQEFLEELDDISDPWLLFLKALFLSRLTRKDDAITTVLRSIELYKWNWSAWSLLASLIDTQAELDKISIRLPFPQSHPLYSILRVKIMSELQCPLPAERWRYDALLDKNHFPESLWLQGLRAKACHDLHDGKEAIFQFEKIFSEDPHRIEDLDVYSNILYTVPNNESKLTELAARYVHAPRNRPEVCCVVGNHYSARKDHEKAVKYFKRATQLDRTYYQGWTLMGQEYMHMNNVYAAIESFRRAVETNAKDYRAWFGLGQTYSHLHMHSYSLHYFQRASSIRPTDSLIWYHIGLVFDALENTDDAITSYQKALQHALPFQALDPNIRLARTYGIMGSNAPPGAILLYSSNILRCNQRTPENSMPEYLARAMVEVARHQLTIPHGDYILARELMEKIIASDSNFKPMATDIYRQLKTRYDPYVLNT